MVHGAAKERGQVDYPIDLEHLSLDQESRHFDPDALAAGSSSRSATASCGR
jgi:hypothetical protein